MLGGRQDMGQAEKTQQSTQKPVADACPWPDAQAQRRRALNRVGQTFDYLKCPRCTRWYGATYAIGGTPQPVCDLCKPKKLSGAAAKASK